MKSSFGLYEALRIIIPGFYFSSLLFLYWECFLHTFIPLTLGIFTTLLLFLLFMLIAGLTMYAKETPKRRKAFLENQPSTYLQSKARLISGTEPLNDDETRKLYFYLLNNSLPPIFHDKIFFFGTIYHTMIQMRRTSFWFGVLALASIALKLSMNYNFQEISGLIVFSILVLCIYVLNVRYNKADRKMQENYQDQIFWLEMNEELVTQLLKKRRKK